MDDTQQSRASDAASAATRKRRSSILKSQRPARTPFSELEFNVATPTDTAKSRRVSFSRRTGVAEFVTNEATTTWKNFYEEHNKSLESSNNDSEANASRQPVGHLGKRIFDQQFEEVEAVDFISDLANGSLNNVNFSQQLASLETTSDGKLTAPHNKLELSVFTEQSKLFGNDFSAPTIGENSGKIDINFSAIQQIEKDDLDEIERDLERGSNNMGYHGPFAGTQNTSEYIEVDLNMTHVVKNDEDMSITDTVRSPVHDVSRSASIDKKLSLNNDWVVDKENMAINPYAAPSESNFADQEPDQVLVFDGKRLTLQPDVPAKDKNYRQTLLPNSSADTPQRKTIVLNVNDDLPNFIDEMLNSKCENFAFSGFQEMKMNDDEVSETYSVNSVDIKPKRTTIHDHTGNISMTCALPTNIICHSAVITPDNHAVRRPTVFDESASNISMTEPVPVKLLSSNATLPERRRTVVYEDDAGNISITQAVPSNILTTESFDSNQKHKTIVFDTDEGNISVTQSLSSKILDDKVSKRQTIVFDNDACNVSITQGLPANIILPAIQEKRRTIIYENDTGNISVTQSLPTNLILPNNMSDPENGRTVIYEDDTGNISVTQSLPANVLLEKIDQGDNRANVQASNPSEQNVANNISAKHSDASNRRTIVNKDDTSNMSLSQSLHANVLLEKIVKGDNRENVEGSYPSEQNFANNISATHSDASNRRTIVSKNDTSNISLSQSLHANVLLEKIVKVDNRENVEASNLSEQNVANSISAKHSDASNRRTIVNEDDTNNISIVQSLLANVLSGKHEIGENRENVEASNPSEQKLPNNNISAKHSDASNRRTIVHEDDADNKSITKSLQSNVSLAKHEIGDNKENVEASSPDDKNLTNNINAKHSDASNRRSIVHEDHADNNSITKSLQSNVSLEKHEVGDNRENMESSNPREQNFANNISAKHSDAFNRRTIVYDDDTGNISITQPLQSNVLLDKDELGDSRENVEANNRREQNLPHNISAKHSASSNRRTIVFEDDTDNISMTQAIPTQFISENTKEKTLDTKEVFPINRRNNRRTTTIAYDNDIADVSMTEPISAAIIDEATNEKKTIVYDEDEANLSVTLAVSTNVYLLDELNSEEMIIKPEKIGEVIDASQGDHKSTVLGANDFDSEMSMTMAIPKTLGLIQEAVKRRTVIFDKDNDISINKYKSKNRDLTEQEQANPCSDVIVLQTSTTNSMPSVAPNAAEQGDLKSTMDIYRNMISESKVMSCVNFIEDIACPLEEEASTIHPKVEMKEKQLNLVSSKTAMDEDEKLSYEDRDAVTQTVNTESLLNMSVATVGSSNNDKNIMAQIISDHSSVVVKNSSEAMFYIMTDSDGVTQTDEVLNDVEARDDKPKQLTENHSPILQLEYKVQDSDKVDGLQKKLSELKALCNSNMFNETIVRPDLEHLVERDENIKIKGHSHSIMDANDTKELLEMLSHFTENRDGDDNIDNKNSEDDAESAIVAVKVKDKSQKTEIAELRRLSFAPSRQSIALSREDLLNNISMAQAALQRSRTGFDDSSAQLSPEDDVSTGSVLSVLKQTVDMSSMASARSSNDVVKTLRFEDESVSEMSLRSEEKCSLLKKTTFGETSYMSELHNRKGKVIPTYLKDVSDGIKELMLDLVKPMADNLPYESVLVDRGLGKNPSTQSTQIQANLVTSSQVDLDVEWYSNSASNTNMYTAKSSLTSERNSPTFRSSVKFSTPSLKYSSNFDVLSPKKTHFHPHVSVEPNPSEVLVFDHLNPLNNILLGPINYTNTHTYEPTQSNETLSSVDRSHATEIHYVSHKGKNTCEVENLSIQHRIEWRSHTTQSDDSGYKQKDQHSLKSTSTTPFFTDKSSGASLGQFIDGEVNTLIAMKRNKELLEGSSSLTLVDDAEATEIPPTSPDHDDDRQRLEFSRTHLNDIQEQAAELDKLSKICLSDQRFSSKEHVGSKGKKRIYSPSIDKYRPSVDVTPKPISKIQKISTSPKIHRTKIDQLSPEVTRKMAAEKDVTETIEKTDDTARSPEKKNSKIKTKKAGRNLTVQQLITDCHNVDSNVISDKINLDSLKPKSESFMEFSQSDISFSSSNNFNSMKDIKSTSTTQQNTEHGMQMDWHPEMISATTSNLVESDSGVNVVAKIDMLPFMGSHECEWEPSAVDTWSFRLLHGRVRLTARLEHRHDNATRTRVRGDTPVLEIRVETVQHDRKNPVATMCVRFACDTIRFLIARVCRGPCYASEVPAFLRRCTAAARVALRWGRAMHDAKLHLAYTLDNDGNLSLKVANIPLRSVWEVTMRIELVLNDQCSMPWPRASRVHVSRVVSDVPVDDSDVRRVLAHMPHDWGHAPRTVWRMFRYLKHKTREDLLA